jgi:hypothetical protein
LLKVETDWYIGLGIVVAIDGSAETVVAVMAMIDAATASFDKRILTDSRRQRLQTGTG